MRKFLNFERYSPVILRIFMHGEVDKIKLGKTLFPTWSHVLSQNKKKLLRTVKKKTWYSGRYHSSAFFN